MTADRATLRKRHGIPRGEQAARWLAKQPDNIGYSDASRRFGVSRRAVKIYWQRFGYAPRAFRGEIAARWLAEQEGDVGYLEAAQRFGLQRETVRQAWLRLGLGKTPRDRSNCKERGLAEEAARWLVEQEGDVGYGAAGERFKISAKMIRDAWKQLQFDKTPREKQNAARRAAVLELARAGKTRAQIKALLGVRLDTISAWCKAANVAMKRVKSGLPAADLDAVTAGLEVIRTGGSIAEGASAANVSCATLHRYAKAAGIKPTPPDEQDPQRQSQRRGRSAQAALLIEQEGFSVGEAATIVMVAPRNVRAYLRRHGRGD